MNREIKFRAWDKENKVMMGGVSLYFSNGEWKDEKVELMQFTGLYDSKGVEIYEGDIVRRNYYKPTYSKVVEWDEEGGWTIRPLKSGWLIIGNIFETPELLKQKNDPK